MLPYVFDIVGDWFVNIRGTSIRALPSLIIIEFLSSDYGLHVPLQETANWLMDIFELSLDCRA